MSREFDILLWGVTGWTGVHLAEYFAQHYPPSSRVRWAMVARNKEKMQKVVSRLDNAKHHWINAIECIQVDNLDEEAVNKVVSRAKVIATVVGPYETYGEPLVKACVQAGTHYCDISGEVSWIARMIEKYHDEAAKNNVFITHCCGFDSVPSDLGVFALVDHIQEVQNEECTQVKGYFVGAQQNNLCENSKTKGGGGTIASLFGAVKNSWKSFMDPYYLTGKDNADKADCWHFPQLLLGYEGVLKDHPYTGHFVMSLINEKTVRRTNYLLNYKYGKDFSYHEAQGYSSLLAASLMPFGTIIGYSLIAFPPTRALLQRILPQPSSWPPERPDSYKPGSFEFRIIAQTRQNNTYQCIVRGADEPGWSETAKMLAESSLTLFHDVDKVRSDCKMRGGVITPACLGRSLLARLRDKGMDFRVEKVKNI